MPTGNAIQAAFTIGGSPTQYLNVVSQYGADPTGAADSTTALNNGASAAASAGNPLYIPGGTYKITAKLNWTQVGLQVIGSGSNNTVIQQATANTGVAHAGAHYQSIQGLTLGYSAQRGSSETNSICLSLASASEAAVNSRYNDLNLKNGQTGMANDASNTVNATAFSAVFENIRVQTWSQSAINIASPVSATGCVWRNIYCNNNNSGAQTSAGVPFYLSGFTESVIDQLNVEFAVLTTHAIQLDTLGAITLNSVHAESNNFTGDNTAVIDLSGGNSGAVTVNGLVLESNTFGGATKNGIVRFDAFGMGAVINGCWMNANTITNNLYSVDFGGNHHCRAWLYTGGQALSVTANQTGGTSGTDSLSVYNFDVANPSGGLQVAEGSNAKQGTATLSAGTIVVSNTSVTASSRILLTAQDNSSTGALRVSARTAGTSFTITSSNAGDSGVVAYEIFEPG